MASPSKAMEPFCREDRINRYDIPPFREVATKDTTKARPMEVKESTGLSNLSALAIMINRAARTIRIPSTRHEMFSAL